MNFLKNLFGKKEKQKLSYEDFWNWFIKNEKNFFDAIKQQRNIERDFFDLISPKLNEIREGFFFLTGMFNQNTVELIITPDGAIKNIVFAEELIAAAPAINGWKFTALKPAITSKDVDIRMGDIIFSENNMSFYSNDFAGMPDQIDITIVRDDVTKENHQAITNGVYIFLDNYLGELNFATTIDNLTVVGKNETNKELIPVNKLKDFLIWREKEFVEKYEGLRYNTENDKYIALEAQLSNGKPLIAIINQDILEWDNKASHPWVLKIEITYDGDNNNGMPGEKAYQLLNEIEDGITDKLKDFEGYLNVGRQTADNVREVYFACKEFRQPSKVMDEIRNKYLDKMEVNYSIYQDKYWQSFNQFKKNID